MATPLYDIRRRVREKLLEPYALVTPGSPLVAPQGTAGATSYSYAVASVNATGISKASQAKACTTGNATLDATNYNQITWILDPAATSYRIYRTATDGTPTTTGLIGTATAAVFNDTGLAGDSATAPTENTSGIESPFWNDDELTRILIDGCKDLWKGIVDLHRNHFATIDATNVSLAASATSLTGVPADCFRVLSLEPRDLTSAGVFRHVTFRPRPYQSSTFQRMRALGNVSATDYDICYDLLNAGSPVAAPTIVVAPSVSSAITCRLVYVHTLSATLSESDDNPIPGESDNALIAWGVAYARAQEREDRAPDPSWLAVYSTEKQNLLVVLSPRQEQEPEVVEDAFGGYSAETC